MSRTKEEASTFFHCAPIGLSVGSIIQPGNWGRVIRLSEYQAAPNTGLPTFHFREALLEISRQAHAPKKPSRLNCVFTCPTLTAAISFRDKYQRTNLIYEVVPVDRSVVTHLGDYELVIAPYPPRYFQSMLDFARDYWTSSQPQSPEVLFSCAVQIVSVPQVPQP